MKKSSWTPERRKAQAERLREIKRIYGPVLWSDERRKAQSERFKGKKASDETKEKMRQAKLGVKKSPEHKEAMRQAQLKNVQKVRAYMAEHNCSYREAQTRLKNERKDK